MSSATKGHQMLRALEKRVVELERRLAVMERSIKLAPDNATVRDLGEELEKRLDA